MLACTSNFSALKGGGGQIEMSVTILYFRIIWSTAKHVYDFAAPPPLPPDEKVSHRRPGQ